MRCYTVQINPFQSGAGIFDHLRLDPHGMLSLGGGPARSAHNIHIDITDEEWNRGPLKLGVCEAKVIVDGTEIRIYEADIREKGGEPIISYNGQDSDSILVLWDVRSAFGGTVELDIPSDVRVVAQQESIHADGHSYVRGVEALLVLKPGQSVRALREGASNLYPQSVLSFPGGCGGPKCSYEEEGEDSIFPPDPGEEEMRALSEFRT